MDEIVSVLSCARVNESYFGGKTWSPSSLTSFNNNNRANFPGEKSAIKLSGESIFGDYSKKIKLNFVLVMVHILAFSINE